MNIKQHLTEHGIRYETLRHAESFVSTRTATAMDVPQCQLVKTVLLRADNGFRYFVAVLPADGRVDLALTSRMLNGADVQLATEEEITERCPDCERGILPPFGSQFDVETIVDESLSNQSDLYFCGDSHSECIRLGYADYYELEHPLVARIREQPGAPGGVPQSSGQATGTQRNIEAHE